MSLIRGKAEWSVGCGLVEVLEVRTWQQLLVSLNQKLQYRTRRKEWPYESSEPLLQILHDTLYHHRATFPMTSEPPPMATDHQRASPIPRTTTTTTPTPASTTHYVSTSPNTPP